MGTSTIHPSQRRLSCDVCRRHKTRCQRIRQNDPKCARCTMLGEECNIGGQKKVGRPRKSDSAPGQRAGKESTEEPRAKPVRSQKKQTTAKNQQSDPSPSSVSPDSGIFLKMNDQHGIEIMMFSTTTIPTTTTSTAAPPVVGTTTNVTSSLPPPVPWNVSSCFKHSSAFADHDWNMDENDVLKTKSSQSDLTVTCSDPASLVIPELGAPMGSIDLSDALSKLSKLNNDLHIRMAAIESHRSVMTLNSILFREGPLFIDNSTLGEFTMRSTQELFQVLSRFLNNRQCHAPLNGGHNGHGQGPSPNLASPFPSASLQPLLAPLALTITAVFTQLISLYEVFLKHMILWLENIAAEPLRPIPGLRIGEAWPQDLCAQGIRFSNASLNLLERIEQILGLTGRPEWGGPGLLSIQQIDLLWSVLDGGEGIAPGHGFMRPAYVKRSLRKASSVLSRVMPR
ncbi:C6 zinc finger domain protein [Diaporthe sp. PMI_573]|nr:C6 zinc finger domain protein [Diaporthaceae sp. PMI_573]